MLLRSSFELFVWRLRASSSPAAHLGDPNKFDCSRFGRRVESEKLQFRPLLPRKIAVLSDWRNGKKMKIFHLKEHFKQFKTASYTFTEIPNWNQTQGRRCRLLGAFCLGRRMYVRGTTGALVEALWRRIAWLSITCYSILLPEVSRRKSI